MKSVMCAMLVCAAVVGCPGGGGDPPGIANVTIDINNELDLQAMAPQLSIVFVSFENLDTGFMEEHDLMNDPIMPGQMQSYCCFDSGLYNIQVRLDDSTEHALTNLLVDDPNNCRVNARLDWNSTTSLFLTASGCRQ